MRPSVLAIPARIIIPSVQVARVSRVVAVVRIRVAMIVFIVVVVGPVELVQFLRNHRIKFLQPMFDRDELFDDLVLSCCRDIEDRQWRTASSISLTVRPSV